MAKKELKYAGYAPIEVTETGDAFIAKNLALKNRWEVGMSHVVTCLNKGWSFKYEPIQEGVRVVSCNMDDVYGNGAQVYVSSEADDVLTATFVQFWKLSEETNFLPTQPTMTTRTKGSYR